MSDPDDPLDADSVLSQTPPKKAPAAATKKSGSKPLADVENESIPIDDVDASEEVKASSKYQKVRSRAEGHKEPCTDSCYLVESP
jgi:DNA topoisomerase-2